MKAPRNGYPPLSVANYLIGLAAAENKKVSFPQLQAMMYLSHGWHLALTGRPLVSEPFYVYRNSWFKGPLLGSIYVEFSRYGAIGGIPAQIPGYSLYQADAKGYAKRIMSRVWKLYGERPGYALVGMSRAEGTPWHTVSSKGDPLVLQSKISNEEIKRYFEPRMSARPEGSPPRPVARRATWFEQLWSWVVGQ